MTSGRSVILAFAAAAAVYVVTHLLPVPGSVHLLAQATGGQPILDLSPSFTAGEVYDRLAAFGGEGRAMYRRTLLTSDIVFPLSLTAFFFLFARHAAEQTTPLRAFRALLLTLPFAYFLSDLLENAAILKMLTDYPLRHGLIGDNLGYVTVFKRIAQIAALLLPLAFFFVAGARRLSAPARD